MLFTNELHEDFGTWPLAYTPYGGADFGEVRAVADAIGGGDDGAYYEAWNVAANRLKAEAETALVKGHNQSAQELYLRASAFHATSFHPLYGAPVDPRLLVAFRMQVEAFNKGLTIGRHPASPRHIPFGEVLLPAYFIPAQGFEDEVRPLIIFNNGYDATMTDMYFASAVAACRRGYHCLLFDGPGQGAMLYEHGIPLRPDWESVINAVVEFALSLPLVDPRRIALSGWSLGGHLAPRGASGEKRIAALIADPGTWSIADGFRHVIVHRFGIAPEEAQDLGALDQSVIDRASAELFTMEGRAELIQCPTLITQSENDALAADAGAFYDRLRCPKTLMRFTAAEGADGHCEMDNRSLLNRRVLDWLDEQFKQSSGS